MKHNRFARAVVAIAGAGILSMSSIPAQAASSDSIPISAGEEAQLREFWTTHEVSNVTQDALLESLRKTGLIDSMTGAEPVNVDESVVGGVRETVTSFADGSITVDSVEAPDSSFSPLSVGNCRSENTGSGFANYYDCQASSSNGPVTLGFYISYHTTSKFDNISDVNSAYRKCIIGTCENPKLGIKKKKEDSLGSAWASATTLHTNVNGNGTRKYEMRALVGGNKAWTRWEMP